MMFAITKNAFMERLRKKELYMIVLLAILLFALCGSDAMVITADGVEMNGYENKVMILHTLIHAAGCFLAVVLSLKTIPNEYERRNSHLVWVRGISQSSYHAQLTIANILSSLVATGVLYLVLLVYMLRNGQTERIFYLIPAFLLTACNVATVSLVTSALSILLPTAAAGAVGILAALTGVFYGILKLYQEAGGWALKILLWIFPDMNAIQSQAYRLLLGKSVEIGGFQKEILISIILVIVILAFHKREA